ncbi:hypothetical protein ACP275_14G155900 [Erythranthe tilingii]
MLLLSCLSTFFIFIVLTSPRRCNKFSSPSLSPTIHSLPQLHNPSRFLPSPHHHSRGFCAAGQEKRDWGAICFGFWFPDFSNLLLCRYFVSRRPPPFKSTTCPSGYIGIHKRGGGARGGKHVANEDEN